MIRTSGIRNEFEIHNERFLYLVLGNTWVEQLYTGTLYAEGPVYFADGDYLLWSLFEGGAFFSRLLPKRLNYFLFKVSDE